MHQEYLFRGRSCHREPAEYWQVSLTTGKEYIYIHPHLDRKKGEGRAEWVELDLYLGVVQVQPGSWSRGEILTSGPIGWERREAFEAVREWCNWFVTVWMVWEPHRGSMLWPYLQQTGTGVNWWAWWLGAGAYGLERNLRVRTAVDVGRGHEGMVGWKFAVGNAFWGNPGGHGGRVLLLSHNGEWNHYYSLSLPTCQLWAVDQWRKTPVRVDFLVPDVSSNRERPAMETLECQLQRLEKTPYRAIFPAPIAIDFPVYLALLKSPWSKQPHHFHEWSSLGQTQPSMAALSVNSYRLPT